jgi:hypothetical protein
LFQNRGQAYLGADAAALCGDAFACVQVSQAVVGQQHCVAGWCQQPDDDA